jgi:hypothetical protein
MPVQPKLKVIPGASCTAISDWLGHTLKIQVSTAPERGKTNRARAGRPLHFQSLFLSGTITEIEINQVNVPDRQ